MKKVIIFGKNWPEPKSSAAGMRMMQLISLFREQNYKIHFISSARPTGFNEELEDLGIKTQQLAPNRKGNKQLFRDLNPDVVLFDRFMMEEQFGWQIAESCPQALRILDLEDLHFLREAREQLVKKKNTENIQIFNSIARREIASILRSDLSLVIAEFELEILKHKFKIDSKRLVYLPFLYDSLSKDWMEQVTTFENRKEFVFIGNFLHRPNFDSVLYLKKEVWPLIKQKLPKAQLRIYGAYASAKVHNLHNVEAGFLIEGRAEKVGPILSKCRVLLAPLRFGAGLKGKFFDAMHSGLPAVTTPIGAEGIAGELSFPGTVKESGGELARAAIQLYTDKNRWQEKIEVVPDLINQRFSKDVFRLRFFDRLAYAYKHRKHIREENFMQQMMMHHRVQSTKYLSRWIQSKNENSNPINFV